MSTFSDSEHPRADRGRFSDRATTGPESERGANHPELRTAYVGPLTSAGQQTWEAIAELAQAVPAEQWSVVGGQMVAIHAAVAGVEPPRTTDDGDVVVDVRVHGRKAMRRIASALTDAGFTTKMSPDGKDRKRLQAATEQLLADDDHRAWRSAPNPSDAKDTVRRLLT
jgi:hypothetical protein